MKHFLVRTLSIPLLAGLLLASPSSMLAKVGSLDQLPKVAPSETPQPKATLTLSKIRYIDQLHGFWLGQSLANWTGLVTEMDKIGGEGTHGEFYTREDWGKPDQPAIWGEGKPSHLSATIDWVFQGSDGIWGSDDDTDMEYLYQHLMIVNKISILSPEQIRDGWLKHIYADEDTPFVNEKGEKENYLWVSNQRAHDLMRLERRLPPATSDPADNQHYEMIDAQLSTEIFGLFAPGRPEVALKLAKLPIQTTARFNAQWAAEFYVIMHSLAPAVDKQLPINEQVLWLAERARSHLPNDSYSAKMYDFVKSRYEQGVAWEQVRDELYIRYQIEEKDGYTISSKQLYCNGCFASGINFAASLVSLFYGQGNFQDTVKIAVLCGWDSDNPAATWGGLLGFMQGKEKLEQLFGQTFSDQYHIHRTRRNFPVNIDTFSNMAEQGIEIVERVVIEHLSGKADAETNSWTIPIFLD